MPIEHLCLIKHNDGTEIKRTPLGENGIAAQFFVEINDGARGSSWGSYTENVPAELRAECLRLSATKPGILQIMLSKKFEIQPGPLERYGTNPHEREGDSYPSPLLSHWSRRDLLSLKNVLEKFRMPPLKELGEVLVSI